jgi:hypothetical protein
MPTWEAAKSSRNVGPHTGVRHLGHESRAMAPISVKLALCYSCSSERRKLTRRWEDESSRVLPEVSSARSSAATTTSVATGLSASFGASATREAPRRSLSTSSRVRRRWMEALWCAWLRRTATSSRAFSRGSSLVRSTSAQRACSWTLRRPLRPGSILVHPTAVHSPASSGSRIIAVTRFAFSTLAGAPPTILRKNAEAPARRSTASSARGASVTGPRRER